MKRLAAFWKIGRGWGQSRTQRVGMIRRATYAYETGDGKLPDDRSGEQGEACQEAVAQKGQS
jgi:hypothetical protein